MVTRCYIGAVCLGCRLNRRCAVYFSLFLLSLFFFFFSFLPGWFELKSSGHGLNIWAMSWYERPTTQLRSGAKLRSVQVDPIRSDFPTRLDSVEVSRGLYTTHLHPAIMVGGRGR